MHASRALRFRCLAVAGLLAAAAPLAAQQVRVLPVENVRVGYAQVLHVEPVYQTLRATAVEQDCTPDPVQAKPAGTLSRMAQAVKGAITRDGNKPAADKQQHDCRPTTVQRTYRTPIAYDVDYIYKGMKFRSRLASDPGNMLRVRVSVTPYEAIESDN
jgi:uncharacterized protein YcfJ